MSVYGYAKQTIIINSISFLITFQCYLCVQLPSVLNLFSVMLLYDIMSLYFMVAGVISEQVCLQITLPSEFMCSCCRFCILDSTCGKQRIAQQQLPLPVQNLKLAPPVDTGGV